MRIGKIILIGIIQNKLMRAGEIQPLFFVYDPFGQLVRENNEGFEKIL